MGQEEAAPKQVPRRTLKRYMVKVWRGRESALVKVETYSLDLKEQQWGAEFRVVSNSFPNPGFCIPSDRQATFVEAFFAEGEAACIGPGPRQGEEREHSFIRGKMHEVFGEPLHVEFDV